MPTRAIQQMSGEGGDGMMKALSKITGQAKALKFAMDLAKKLSGNLRRLHEFEFCSYISVDVDGCKWLQ